MTGLFDVWRPSIGAPRDPVAILLRQVVEAQQTAAARGEAEAAHTALAVAEARREYETKLAAAMSSMQDSHAQRCDLLEQHWQQAAQVGQQTRREGSQRGGSRLLRSL